MGLQLLSSERTPHTTVIFYGFGRETPVYAFTVDEQDRQQTGGDAQKVVDRCIDALCADEWFEEVDPAVVRERLLEQNLSGYVAGKPLQYTSSRNYGRGLQMNL